MFWFANRVTICGKRVHMADDQPTSLTSASLVYERLRNDILTSSLPASAKLRIDSLKERYGVGPIPLREALNRLLSEGFVALEDRKGFFVPAVSLEELLELTRTRCWLNEIIIREALKAGDVHWEERVVLASHYLTRTSRSPTADGAVINRQWEERHRDFHMALVEACPSRWLRDFHANLFDSADRYRHQYFTAEAPVGERDVGGEHLKMLDLALARDSAGLIKLYNRHIEQTTQIILESVSAIASKAEPRGRRKTLA